MGKTKTAQARKHLGQCPLERSRDNSSIPLKWILDKHAEDDRWMEISLDCAHW